MFSTLALAGLALLIFYTITQIISLRRNIAIVRKCGLPYVVVPAASANALWMLTRPVIIPILETVLPRTWTENWIEYAKQDFWRRLGQKPFEKYGNSFFIVSPQVMDLTTQDPELIAQIAVRPNDFPKPVHYYTLLDLFGKNVVTVEGGLWKFHRKTTSASFNEKNNARVWAESVHQTQGMIDTWLAASANGRKSITSLPHDTMVLALNIIAYVGFGLRFFWPGQSIPEDIDPKVLKYAKPMGSHKLNFAEALTTMLDRVVFVMLLPKWFCRLLPFQAAKEASLAHSEFEQYVQELLDEKKADARKGEAAKEGMDLMRQLVHGQVNNKNSDKQLSDSEIRGNAFVIIVAGHETSANIMHFSIVELAGNPGAQRSLQADIDRILGSKTDPSKWDYEENINPLLASYAGATINETLRMMPPVVALPKQVNPKSDQPITTKGVTHILPAGSIVSLILTSAQRNPNYWPTEPSKLTGAPTDVDDFLPERWFRRSRDTAVSKAAEETDDGSSEGSDTSVQLFRPVRGSYLPFSDGPRSCLGRRVAQVELLATLATVFQKYSVELAVDEWASDEEVARMSKVERAAVYAKAQADAKAKMARATTLITLKLNDEQIPIRLVPRGQERFVADLA